MKKITLVLLAVFSAYNFCTAQPNLIVQAPLDNSTTQVRAPNGLSTYAYLRACALVTQADLLNIPNNSTLSVFGFTLATTSTVTIPVAGNFTVYLQNTTDASYLKGTNWATIPTGMTSVYANVMTIPLSSTSTSITVTLSTPFVYTGGALYVAYDWYSAGPYSTAPATYLADNGTNLNPGCASAASGVSAPTTLGTTAFRPSFLFGFTNPYTNDVQIIGLEAPGNIPLILNTAHNVNAIVKNASSGSLSNITVSLNVSGANPSTNSQVIPSLAAGASTLISFPALNPNLAGTQTVNVSVASDENNSNNSATYAQHVNCNVWSQNPAAGSFTSNAVGFGTGSGILATPFFNPVTSTITAIRGAISTNSTNAGNSVYAALLSSTGVVLATTNTITLAGSMAGTFQQFEFATPQNLNPSTTYYLGLAQLAPSNAIAYYPAGTFGISYLPANLYYSAPIAGGSLTAIPQNYGYFGLEAVLGHTANIQLSSNSPEICLGECADITAQGTDSYTWSTSSTSTSITICPTVTATYSVSGVNTIGCSSKAAITITVNPLPNVTASANQSSICLGGSVTLNAGGASTYLWDLGATTSSLTDSPVATTVYTVTGTNALGCSEQATVEVTVNSFTPGITSPATICAGDAITISATGGAGTSYTWSTGFTGFASLPALTPSTTTEYSVISTGSNGCNGTNSTTVTVNPLPIVTASAQRTLMCRGESNTLTATGADTYSWSTNATTPVTIITPSSNITYNYIVTGSNAAGCSNSVQISVKVEACTGISDAGAFSSLEIYPNPTEGLFIINKNTNESELMVRVYNTLGKLIHEELLLSDSIQLDIRNENSGVYFVSVFSQGKQVQVAKIIKN